jgi:glutamine phosphoribosylpyrophosphate amidotransferase
MRKVQGMSVAAPAIVGPQVTGIEFPQDADLRALVPEAD